MPRKSKLVQYNEGKPKHDGVYACRIRIPYSNRASNLMEDEFLMWSEGQWYYLGSAEKFRCDVFYWIGPLERKHKPKNINAGLDCPTT